MNLGRIIPLLSCLQNPRSGLGGPKQAFAIGDNERERAVEDLARRTCARSYDGIR